MYFIRVNFYNPCSHEMDWCIVGSNDEEVSGEESAKLFSSKGDAEAWCHSSDAEQWKPCSFDVLESVY